MNKKWNTEAEARAEILDAVADYYKQYKSEKKSFEPGDRITYAARVFDEKEMCSLVDSALDFWLTTGRFADEFEAKFAQWLGVKYAHLVNSGSSANLIAFSALTAPELGEQQIKRGAEVQRDESFIASRVQCDFNGGFYNLFGGCPAAQLFGIGAERIGIDNLGARSDVIGMNRTHKSGLA